MAAEEVAVELGTDKVGVWKRKRRQKQHPVECQWRGENVQCDPEWKDGSAEAEEEQTMECGTSEEWKYQRAGIAEPVDPDRT